ncbi:MAG TPA: cyclic nucleotide-binding domain-containing protein [Candidatus Ozemobacteraceae bacterium]|nr:cyclic nucleotide-binding domain-containing protein [Candidatus Ozemobacteraceae bacterium]
MVQTDFLKAVSLFSELSEEELRNVSKQAEVVNFVRDAFICKEGQQADSMFIIKSGIVQIFCDDGKGGRKVLTHLKLGEYFGEMALLTEEPRTASAVALAETEVIRINKDSFHNLLKTSPGVSLSIIRTLCNRLSKTNIGSAQTKMHNVYAVLGPDTSSGKSLFARNLAMAMQKELGCDVLLYDPNLRDERVARSLGVEKRSRIIDELIDREKITDLKKYVVRTDCGLLTLLPQENGLTDVRLKEFHTFSLMQTVMEHYEYVVVDSSSMFTKVTKEIVQNCDKIIYLISSKNVSIAGLMDHFDETRRGWKVAPEKIVFGVNHMTDDPTQESLITEKDHERISFEIPFCKELKGKRDPEAQLLVQTSPDHPLSKVCRKQTMKVLFDQSIGLFMPTFDDEPARAELARRWVESGVAEFSQTLKNVEVQGPVTRHGGLYHILTGHTSKWSLNDQVVKIVDFSNRFKKEFNVSSLILSLNNQESII